MLNGQTLQVMDDEGHPVVDDSFLILVNAAAEGVEYTLPEPPDGQPWRQVLDTESIENPFCDAKVEEKVIVGGRSIRVYSDCTEDDLKAPVRSKLTRTL
jgi:glycogen operon protein